MDFDLDLSSPSLSSQGTNSSHGEPLAHIAGLQQAGSVWDQLAEALAYTEDVAHIPCANNPGLRSLLSSSNASIFAGIREIEDLHDKVPVTLQHEHKYSRSFTPPLEASRKRDSSHLEVLATEVTLLQAQNRKLIRRLSDAMKDNKWLAAQAEKLQHDVERLCGASSLCNEVLHCDLSPTSRSSLSSDEILEQVQTLDSIDLSWAIPHTPNSSSNIMQHGLLSDEFGSGSPTNPTFGSHSRKLPYKPFTSLPNQFFYWEWPTGTPSPESSGKGSGGKGTKRLKLPSSP